MEGMRKILTFLNFILVLSSCGKNSLGAGPTVTSTTGNRENSPLADDFSGDLSAWECIDTDNFNMDSIGGTSDDCDTNFTVAGGQLKVQTRGADIWGTTHVL